MFAIIPAKLHSTSCPAKNGRHIGGLPLITQAVAYARQEGLIPIISTPDAAVAALAQNYEVAVNYEPERGNPNGDSLSLIRSILKQLDACKFFCLLQPTSPFRQPGLLAKIWRDLRASETPKAFYTARKLKLQGRVTNGSESHTLNSPRRQINPNWVYPADGNIFAFHRDLIPAEGTDLLSDAWEPVTTAHPLTHLDIDSEEDFRLASDLAESPVAAPLLPSRFGLRIALITNCPLWTEDHSDTIDNSYDLVVRINDLRSLDTHCTGTRTDIAYILPGTNYIANPPETQHSDALRSCRRVIFARQVVNSDESLSRMRDMAARHNLPDNWSCIEEGTSPRSTSKTVAFEAAFQLTRSFPGCALTIYGDRHAGTRALEHAGVLGQPEDFAMDELTQKYNISWIQPMQDLH